MPLRLVEVTVPIEDRDFVDKVICEQECTLTWVTASNGTKMIGRASMSADKTEAVMDELEKRYRKSPVFRVDLIALEASIPRIEEKEEDPDDDQELKKKKSASRVSREELYHDLQDATTLNREYVAMVVLSSVVAVVGLYYQSVVTLIGAMVIAPLLGPNVALALAATLGDKELARKAVFTNMTGLLIALWLSVVLGMMFDLAPDNGEVLLRTTVQSGDIVVAIASGAAGVLAFTSGAPSSLIGVMVAVALMPPLVTIGILIGNQQYALANGAAILLMTNIICINLAGVLTFLAQGIRPLNWWDQGRASKSAIRAIFVWLILLLALLMIMRVYLL